MFISHIFPQTGQLLSIWGWMKGGSFLSEFSSRGDRRGSKRWKDTRLREDMVWWSKHKREGRVQRFQGEDSPLEFCTLSLLIEGLGLRVLILSCNFPRASSNSVTQTVREKWGDTRNPRFWHGAWVGITGTKMLLVHEKKTDGNGRFWTEVTGNASPSCCLWNLRALLSHPPVRVRTVEKQCLPCLWGLLWGSKGTEHMRMLCKWEVFAVTIISIGKTSISASLSNWVERLSVALL